MRIIHGDHTRLKIWYNPCIIRQYIHGKTDENHVLFSKYIINKICYQLFIFNLKPWSYEMEAVCYWK